jgi:flagellar P-ring protein precursor FlgI
MGKQVRVSPVAILHGNLTVEIQTIMQVSQPQPFAQGTTEVVPQPTTTSAEKLRFLPPLTTLVTRLIEIT